MPHFGIIKRRMVSASTREEAGGEVLIRHLRRKHPEVRVIYVDEGFKEVWYRIEVKVLQKGRIRGAWGTAKSVPPEYISVNCGADFCMDKEVQASIQRLRSPYRYERNMDRYGDDIPLSLEEIVLNHENGIPNTF